ncbi:RING finger protein 223 [Engraulis encrasicolus]|uniref:RING finger protein 223 n=1 Tax=Engraulis encrasicolus TaxID=184585 RepID=UPI002FCF7CF0
MDHVPKVWHSQVVPLDDELGYAGGGGGPPPPPSSASFPTPECSICYNNYDNVFKTPKLLACTHTFCLECLSRLMAASGDHADERGRLCCPFCRHLTPIPERGPPALTTSQEVLSTLPVHLRQEEPVWLEGSRLCYQSPPPSPASPNNASAFCICIDIGASGTKAGAGGGGAGGGETPSQTQTRGTGLLDRMTDWKRLLLFLLLLVLLVVIVLWPLQCIVTTGSMRCLPKEPHHPSSTVAPTTTLASSTPFLK